MDLCPVTFKSFVVQWSAKIAGCQPPLKPLHITISLFTCHIHSFEFVNRKVPGAIKIRMFLT